MLSERKGQWKTLKDVTESVQYMYFHILFVVLNMLVK